MIERFPFLTLFPFLLQFLNLNYLNGQSLSLIDYVTQNECENTEYYDTRQLSCITCTNGTVSSLDHLTCSCPHGFLSVNNSCQRCSPGQSISWDNLFCLVCDKPNNDTLQNPNNTYCPPCPQGYATIFTLSTENTPLKQQCLQCPNKYKVSPNGAFCIPCKPAEATSCICQRNECDPNDLTDPETLFQIELENGERVESIYLTENLKTVEKKCDKDDEKACQHLANMCVLQNYKKDKPTACTLFERIFKKNHNRQIGTPWLFYYNTETSIELSREAAIDGAFSFDSQTPNWKLDILAVEYSLDGEYRGSKLIQETDLMTCMQKKILRFGARMRIRCTLSLDKLLTKTHELKLYDFYLLFENDKKQKKLYAIAVVNENIKQFNTFPNRLPSTEMSRWFLTRRTYFIDDVSLFQNIDNSTKSFYRVLETIDVEVQMQTTQDGKILPPFIKVRHKEIRATSTPDFSMTITINYSTDAAKHDRNLEITMAVLCTLSIIWAALSAYSWGRRAGKMIIDLTTLVKLILFECDILADVFLLVIFAMALVITLGYKAQKIPYFVMLTESQENSFKAYLIAATVLKTVSFLHCNIHLILAKTFFIDWERPVAINDGNTQQPRSRDITNISAKAEPVIWRTYLVANEWNELQTYRKTNVAFQLFVVLALTQWMRLGNLANQKTGFSLEEEEGDVQSYLSRFAVDCTIYFIVGMIQWMFHVVILERLFSDPFHNIIDLCSIANISILSLTHPLYGYYIHGKSVHGRADTGIAEMNNCLQKERDNLCGDRGLEAGSELQTFVFSLSKHMKAKFKEITDKLNLNEKKEIKLTGVEATTAKMETIAATHLEMNRFLMDFIEHSHPTADYTLHDISLLESILDVDFTDSTNISYFARDKSEIAFTKAFIYGNEWVFLSFEMLSFCTIDAFTRNHTLAAFVTFTLSYIFKKIISVLFTNNLVKSSFVDQRFMM